MKLPFDFSEADQANLARKLVWGAWIILCLTAIFANGTGDEGDSVQHYLYARFAFQHPVNFFNHWAKPLFVMLAAPFTQIGFTGVKLLNATLLGFQMAMLVRIARHFRTGYYWLIPLLSLAAPMNLTHTLSGLTEPLFASWLTGGVLLLLSGRTAAAYVMFSFLPMVRSEGLIILCPLVLYAVFARHYKYLPLLLVGHLALGVAGYWHYHDILWAVRENPYATFESKYGSGTWYNFIVEMPTVIGWALSVLLILGLVYGLKKLIINNKWIKEPVARDEAWLVYGFFLSFFIAHSIFWYKGIFGSLGLARVMVGIIPMIILIALRGWQEFDAFLPRITSKIKYALLFSGILLSFYLHPTLIHDFTLNAAQQAIINAAKDTRRKLPDVSRRTCYYEMVYVAQAFDVDFFDRYQSREVYRLFSGEPVPTGSLVIWDDKFMPNEGRTPFENLKSDPRLALIGSYSVLDKRYGSNRTAYVFEVKNMPDTISDVHKWVYLRSYDTLSTDPPVVEIAGRKAVKIDKNHEYGPGLEFGLGSFPVKGKLEISFNMYCEAPGKDNNGSFVFTHQNMVGVTDWRSRPLKDESLPAKNWKQVRFIEDLNPETANFDRIKMYVWNTSEIPIYLDDIKVRVLQ